MRDLGWAKTIGDINRLKVRHEFSDACAKTKKAMLEAIEDRLTEIRKRLKKKKGR